MLSFQESKLEKYLAVSAAFAICVLRVSTALSEVATGIALLLGLVLWHKNKESVSVSEDIKGYMKAYGVFLLLLVPSVVFSDNAAASVKEFFRFWVWRFMIFAVVAAFIHRREYLVNMLTAFLAVMSLECLYSLFQVLKHVRPDGRGLGFTPGLSLAGTLCMLLPLVLVILMDSGFEKKLKKVAAFSVISTIIGLLCNKSRGSWLTVLIVVPVATFRYLKQSKKYLAVVLALFLGVAGFMASTPQYVQRVKSITNMTTDTSNAYRLFIWKSATQMVRDHPVTGIGAGRFAEIYKGKYNYAYRYEKFKDKGKFKYKKVRVHLTYQHAHNNFFHIAAESGIIGLVGILYFVGYYLYSSLCNYRKNKNPYDILVFTTCFGYICLFGLIDYSLGLSTGIRIMWFLLAVLLKMKETDNNKSLCSKL